MVARPAGFEVVVEGEGSSAADEAYGLGHMEAAWLMIIVGET